MANARITWLHREPGSAHPIIATGRPGTGGWVKIPSIYAVVVGPDRLIVRNVVRKRQFEATPQAVIDHRGRLVAIGSAAKTPPPAAPGRVQVNPFARLPMEDEDIELGAGLLRAFAQETRMLPILPLLMLCMVIQPRWSLDSDPDERERAALLRLAKRAGARTASVWTGRPLSDQEVYEAFVPPRHRLGCSG